MGFGSLKGAQDWNAPEKVNKFILVAPEGSVGVIREVMLYPDKPITNKGFPWGKLSAAS